MKVQLAVEQFDNGITLKWKSDAMDNQYVVVTEGGEPGEIGRMIWEDLKYVMDSESTNELVMNIEYKPVKEGKKF